MIGVVADMPLPEYGGSVVVSFGIIQQIGLDGFVCRVQRTGCAIDPGMDAVFSGDQRSTSGGARRRRPEIVEDDTINGEIIQCWRVRGIVRVWILCR